jgi:hypothetical protein
MLTGSCVDEAWTTGVQLGEAVLELLRSSGEFSKHTLPDVIKIADAFKVMERVNELFGSLGRFLILIF